ncbi:RelA/SpoT domain-containing protein [Vibrio vulnificus]|nr:RelA/SpoT domain-containing protein [Vibrio vulnificus]MCU8169574.1 RelA/SpoT domain-containing protein [Vibrio vulnificus]
MTIEKNEYMCFLEKFNFTEEDWKNANVDWDTLEAIKKDFTDRAAEFEQAALTVSAILQKQPRVHSVRWRVKNSEHLVAKIIRKRIEKNPKYDEINSDNYDTIITDLVGVRVLHLFKADWKPIQVLIEGTFDLEEPPRAFIREGDNLEQYAGCETEVHKSGYRSIHSIVKTKPFKKDIFIELQIRTIFEEGWSEVDHKVRYPNFSDDPTLIKFLSVFNLLAGSLDDLGTFASELAQFVKEKKQQKLAFDEANRNREDQLKKLEELASENGDLKQAIREFKDADNNVVRLVSPYVFEENYKTINSQNLEELRSNYQSKESLKVLKHALGHEMALRALANSDSSISSAYEALNAKIHEHHCKSVNSAYEALTKSFQERQAYTKESALKELKSISCKNKK